MAQIVIFAPKGVDASAGESALKEAGHEVEVVEATAETLLHMAIGMLEEGGDSEEATEDPLEEPAEEAPAEESSDEAPAEEPAQEGIQPSGRVLVDGEPLNAYVGSASAMNTLYATNFQVNDGKMFYSLNESTFSGHDRSSIMLVEHDGAIYTGSIAVMPAASMPFIVLNQATAKDLGLL